MEAAGGGPTEKAMDGHADTERVAMVDYDVDLGMVDKVGSCSDDRNEASAVGESRTVSTAAYSDPSLCRAWHRRYEARR